MLRAIARYGARATPGEERELVSAFRRGEAVEGPAIAEFEERFAAYHGLAHAIATSYGRMACYYLLRALALPPDSEIIFPALTFWVVPEIARRAGLRPVFVDVDPATFNLDPTKIEAALSERTRVIVPTHLYGQPCEMTPIMRLAEKHDLIVIEDCAQAAGARYRGKRVGAFGHAAFFSFQMLKGVNTYGGGMAITNDPRLAESVREQALGEPLQTTSELARRFLTGWVARQALRPPVFTWWGYPLLALAACFGHYDLSKYLWEKIRPLDPFPRAYRQRYSNAQALLGIRGLDRLDEFNDRARSIALRYARGLADCRGLRLPRVLPEAEHVFYQYSVYASDPARLSRRASRLGVDCETTHVDVCSELALFSEFARECPGAKATERALQLPVHAGMRDIDVERALSVAQELTAGLAPLEMWAKTEAPMG